MRPSRDDYDKFWAELPTATSLQVDQVDFIPAAVEKLWADLLTSNYTSSDIETLKTSRLQTSPAPPLNLNSALLLC